MLRADCLLDVTGDGEEDLLLGKDGHIRSIWSMVDEKTKCIAQADVGMKRKYDTARYDQSVELLRAHFPGCAVTTDMIVAFPGETEEEFGESLDFIRKCGFADMHIFPYSRRPGTPAASMPGRCRGKLYP